MQANSSSASSRPHRSLVGVRVTSEDRQASGTAFHATHYHAVASREVSGGSEYINNDVSHAHLNEALNTHGNSNKLGEGEVTFSMDADQTDSRRRKSRTHHGFLKLGLAELVEPDNSFRTRILHRQLPQGTILRPRLELGLILRRLNLPNLTGSG